MEAYPARLLKMVLDKCQSASFSELRFISGMTPTFVDKEGPHFLDIAYLSTTLVHELHQTCLMLADDPVADTEASATYTFFLRRLGRVQCKYQRRGNIASLILVRDSDATETVGAIRPKRRPSLRAEAKPESKRKGD
jgi:hypothetical protein